MLVVPAFGFPSSSIVRSDIFISQYNHFDLIGFLFSQCEMIAFDEILDGIAERRVSFDQDRLAFHDSHFDEPASQRAGAIDPGNNGALSGSQKMKMCCFGHEHYLSR